MNFTELNLRKEILQALNEIGITEPSEIQKKAIPTILEGYDVIAKSKTGTGKTLAFGAPIIEGLSNERATQALILCPTRELCLQVAREIEKYIKYLDGVKVVAVYGGVPIQKQIAEVSKKPQIIVATPGRLIDHLTRKSVKIKDVKTVVLDEADEMISIGFKDELEKILDFLPVPRQTLFFSATFPKKVQELSNAYLHNPVVIEHQDKNQTVDLITQYYVEVYEKDKLEVLKRFIEMGGQSLSIVFCNTKRKAQDVVMSLQKNGIFAEALHGDLSQQMRDSVMEKFRKGIIDVLVATDVAARGIDVSEVEFVFNFDLPDDSEYYVHRIGRTGRAGKAGISFSFVSPRQQFRIKNLNRELKTDIIRKDIPSVQEVKKMRIEKYLLDAEDQIVEEPKLEYFNVLVEKGYTFEQIAGALLHKHLSSQVFEDIDMNASRNDRGSERAERGRNDRGRNDRGDRNDRGPKTNNAASGRIFINTGKNDGIKLKHLLGAIAAECNINERLIKEVLIKDTYSFATIPMDKIDKVMNLKEINGKRVRIENASQRKR